MVGNQPGKKSKAFKNKDEKERVAAIDAGRNKDDAHSQRTQFVLSFIHESVWLRALSAEVPERKRSIYL